MNVILQPPRSINVVWNTRASANTLAFIFQNNIYASAFIFKKEVLDIRGYSATFKETLTLFPKQIIPKCLRKIRWIMIAE